MSLDQRHSWAALSAGLLYGGGELLSPAASSPDQKARKQPQHEGQTQSAPKDGPKQPEGGRRCRSAAQAEVAVRSRPARRAVHALVQVRAPGTAAGAGGGAWRLLLVLGLWLALLRSVAGEQAPGTRDLGVGEPRSGAREPDWVPGEQRGTGETGGCGYLGSGGLLTARSRLWELPSLSKFHSQSGPQFLPPSNWGWGGFFGSESPKVLGSGERK